MTRPPSACDEGDDELDDGWPTPSDTRGEITDLQLSRDELARELKRRDQERRRRPFPFGFA